MNVRVVVADDRTTLLNALGPTSIGSLSCVMGYIIKAA